jgi:D-alanyl-D-alanine carboxypeptidase
LGRGQTPRESHFSARDVERIDAFLKSRTAPFPFSGTVLVAVDEHVVLNRGYGFADAELEVPNAPTTIFRIGSLTKTLTAAAVLRLAEMHQLSLDDSICRFLTSCPADWSPVHIRHLLAHVSGIPDLFNAIPAAPVQQTRAAIDKVIQSASRTAVDSTPGSTYAYRNFNYMLVGYVIEVATGRSWEDVLRANVFEVAGMPHTAYDDVWAVVVGRARGYDVKERALRNLPYKDHSAFAAGGLRSTTSDLFAFVDAFFAGRLTSRADVTLAVTPVLGDYGYGWQIKHYFGRRMFNHSGGIDGFASHIARYPDDGLTIVVLSNIESEPAKLTACNIAGLLLTGMNRLLSACPES